MTSAERLKQKKANNLLKAYGQYKMAESAGTLKKVSLTPKPGRCCSLDENLDARTDQDVE